MRTTWCCRPVERSTPRFRNDTFDASTTENCRACLQGDQLLTVVAESLLIPLDGFQEALQGARSPAGRQCDSLGGLAVNAGELAFDIDTQQSPRVDPSETVIEQREERNELSAQRPDLLECHS